VLAAGVLVAGPVLLAFFDGGFFAQPRLVAAVVAWLLVLLAALASERPLPRHAPGRLAVAGLVLLSVWSALSLTWAPLGGPAIADVQRLVLYSGVLIAAAAWLGRGGAAAAVEPGVALGSAVVLGYGMSERFLPDLIELERSWLAFGRLEQPITYWNGMGLLAAMGLVAGARLAGNPARPVALRMAGAAVAPLLGGGMLLTLSRSAFAAAAAGLLLLLALSHERGQARSVALIALAAGVTAGLAAALPGLDAPGTERASSSSGVVLLGATVLLSAAAALAQRRFGMARDDAAQKHSGAPHRRRTAVAVVLGLLVLAATVAAVGSSRRAETEGSGPRTTQRLASIESARYRYWEVALETFAAEPLKGAGSAAFRVEWAREGEQGSAARDAHSLYLETAAELGLVGVALLGVFFAGLLASARRALAVDRAAGVGPAAVVFAWAFHAGLDWDWELPAVTLPALVCAGLLVALGDLQAGQRGRSASNWRRASLASRGS
jgi:hypothetical protein